MSSSLLFHNAAKFYKIQQNLQMTIIIDMICTIKMQTVMKMVKCTKMFFRKSLALANNRFKLRHNVGTVRYLCEKTCTNFQDCKQSTKVEKVKEVKEEEKDEPAIFIGGICIGIAIGSTGLILLANSI